MDCVCSDQRRVHEPADEGAGGAHHQPNQALQPRPQPSHQQVKNKKRLLIKRTFNLLLF